jgi:hypothetical protein
MSMRALLRIGVVVLLAATTGERLAAEGHGPSFTATLSPIKITAKPGQAVTRYFELALTDGQPRKVFNARIEDWWRSEDGGKTFYGPAGTIGHSCGKWTTLNPIEAVADPGKPLRVRVTVTVPEKVDAGGFWCALVVDEIPDPAAVEPVGVQVRFLASVAVGIFVSVEPVERAIEILDVDVSQRGATARVRVTGNAPVAVEGRVEFIAVNQKTTTATVSLPRTTVLTEPVRVGTVRVDLPSAQDLPSGRYLVRLILDIGLDHYIGVEREIDLRRDADEQP